MDDLWNLTDEQIEFRSALRRFCEEQIAPHAAEIDRLGEYSWDNFQRCVSMELPALAIPEKFGGAGADNLTHAIMAEELSRVCASTSLMMLISHLGMTPVIEWGSDELREKYLPRVASGESQASYCLSEADAGSDVAAMTCKAELHGDTYVLNGSKYWITNAGISDLYTVFAKTDPAAGSKGISAFVVERDWGVKVSKLEHKMGIKGSPTGEVVLDNVEVPVANRIGEEGEGFAIAMKTLDRSRPRIGAQALGIAQGALDYASGYMKQRKTFGKPISEHQGLQFMVADLAMQVEASRGLVYAAHRLIDNGITGPELTMAGAMAKCTASDVAMKVTTDAVQLLGGYGYTNDFPLERMMRDAKITQIYEGTNQVQRIVIAKRHFAS
jgi:alkylation response protein AidB-like acyl-CoA dehydrogenase